MKKRQWKALKNILNEGHTLEVLETVASYMRSDYSNSLIEIAKWSPDLKMEGDVLFTASLRATELLKRVNSIRREALALSHVDEARKISKGNSRA